MDDSSEELLLDPNELANGGFFSLGAFSISPDHQRLAYSLDTTGEEIYTLFVKELATGKVSELAFEDCDGSMTWANDSLTLFFGELDDTHRPHKLYRYRLDGTAAQEVFHETDGRFFLHCYRSSSERQLLVALGSKTTSEVWALDADQPHLDFTCLAPRVEDHEYDVDHGQLDGAWTWFIRSNRDGINYALFVAADTGRVPTEADWQNLIPHSDEVMLDGVSLNAGAMTLSLRIGGLPVIEVHPQGLPAYRVELPDAAYSLYVQNSLEFASDKIRLRYEALNRPAQVRQLELASGAQQVLKETPVLGVVQCRRLRQPAPVGHLRRWHPGADQPGGQARPARQTDAAVPVRLRRLRPEPRPVVLPRPPEPARPRRRRLPSRMCAAAASWAKPGIAPASRNTSRTPSATLSPAPNT